MIPMTSVLDAPFVRPQALDLITDHQRATLAGHPGYPALAALDDPVQQLLWMHDHGIVSEDDLDEMMTFEEEAPCERERILQKVMAKIEHDHRICNGRLLDQLLRDGLVTADHHAVYMRDPLAFHFDGAADLLHGLIQFDVIPVEEFAAIRARIRAEAGSDGGAQRLRIVDEVQERIDAMGRTVSELESRLHLHARSAASPSLAFGWLGGLLIAFLVWMLR